jgi:hypothetical protein
MEKQTFNMRNPNPGEVLEMHAEAKKIRAKQLRYKILKNLLDGNTVDLTQDKALYEALNRERMEFEQILELHKNDPNVKDCLDQTVEDRGAYDEGKYWNPDSKAKFGKLGHIPNCIYYSRPIEYWQDKRLIKNFFNIFTKFRVSTKPI